LERYVLENSLLRSSLINYPSPSFPLHRFHTRGSRIEVKGDLVWFNDISYPKDTKTNFLITKSKEEDPQPSYYTLYTLYFFLKSFLLEHDVYVRACTRTGMKPVRRADRNSLMSYLNGNRNHVQNLVNKTHKELNPHLFEPDMAKSSVTSLPPPPSIGQGKRGSTLWDSKEQPAAKHRRSRFDKPPAVGPFAERSKAERPHQAESKQQPKLINWPERPPSKEREDARKSYERERRSHEPEVGRSSFSRGREEDKWERAYKESSREKDKWSRAYRESSREEDRRSYDHERAREDERGPRESSTNVERTPAFTWASSSRASGPSSTTVSLDPARSKYQTQATVETFDFGNGTSSNMTNDYGSRSYGSQQASQFLESQQPSSSTQFSGNSGRDVYGGSGGISERPKNSYDGSLRIDNYFGNVAVSGNTAPIGNMPPTGNVPPTGMTSTRDSFSSYGSESGAVWGDHSTVGDSGRLQQKQAYDPFRPTESPPPASKANVPPPPSISGWGMPQAVPSADGQLTGFSSSFSFSGERREGQGSGGW